jgi:hypothetical protein
MPIVTFYKSFLNSSSDFNAFLMFMGVMRFLELPFASFPEIYTSSAVRYSKTLAR